MVTYISLLRGINVSGQKLIDMDTLKKAYTELHLLNAQTYIQSGNVVFQCQKIDDITLMQQTIQQKIMDTFGFNIPILILDSTQINAIIDQNPFINPRQEDSLKVYTTFLSAEPTEKSIDKIDEIAFFPDEFEIIGKVVYVFCPNGYGNTKLTNSFFEKKLKCTASTRNWKTLNELKNMAQKMSEN